MRQKIGYTCLAKSPRSRLAGLWADRSANALAIMGLSMVPLVGAVGVGVDVTQWILWKRELHTAADLGALAGARALADSQPVVQAVNSSLGFNDIRTFTTEAIENAPTSGPFAGDTDKVRVVLSTSKPLPFSGMFMASPATIRVEATAENGRTVPNCVITLDTAGTGVEIVGSASITMDCGLASNSNLSATSSDPIIAGALSAVGAISQGGNIDSDTAINEGVAPIADPFAGKLPTPDAQSSCAPNSWPLVKSDWTINPALHGNCFEGLQINKGVTVTLMPGTYLIGEKGISVAGGATLKGAGVTLIFTSTASPFNSGKVGSFNAAGSSTIQLSAPTSGTYEGVLMYQDPRTPDDNKNWLKITGNSSSNFEGAIYAPSVGVKFTGNSGMNTNCMQIAALYASFEGNTDVTNTCPSGAGAAAFGGGGTVRLVR
ncbi:pilus assembly protein TadG-related protein [Altererythrobacter sp.]|nr:pilus assembly protein TadG-related protein [Altererythrobacter sp.]